MTPADPASVTPPDAPKGATEWTFYDNFVAFPHTTDTAPKGVFAEVVISHDVVGDDGTLGEFKVRWYDFGQREFAVRIEAFHDAWDILQGSDIVGIMRGCKPTPGEFMERLRAAGYRDRTSEYVDPENSLCPSCYTKGYEGRWNVVRVRERVDGSRSSLTGGSDG